MKTDQGHHKMKKFLFVAAGAFLGAVTRYSAAIFLRGAFQSAFPLPTLLINVAGSFILAFILTSGLFAGKWDGDLIIGASAGFLGAFTTFSTLCKEAAAAGRYSAVTAAVYVASSAVLGLLASYAGFSLGRKISLRKQRRNDNG